MKHGNTLRYFNEPLEICHIIGNYLDKFVFIIILLYQDEFYIVI